MGTPVFGSARRYSVGGGPPGTSLSSARCGRFHVGLKLGEITPLITGLLSSTRRSIAGRSYLMRVPPSGPPCVRKSTPRRGDRIASPDGTQADGGRDRHRWGAGLLPLRRHPEGGG